MRASDGKLMWRYPAVANGTANIATPVFFDNNVFYSSDYGTGGALLRCAPQNGEVRAQEVYFTRDMQNHHGGSWSGEWLSLRLQQRDPDLPRVRDRQGDVAAPQRRQGIARLRGRLTCIC